VARFYFGTVMELLLVIGLIAFTWLRFTSARRRESIETAGITGMIGSPLYHAQTVLQVMLVVLMIGAGHLQKGGGGWLPLFVLGATAGDIVALLLIRRALKWRYPV
jgi:hypothetical protein